MTGYQESVTDPSYAGQIIVFTYPLIGNYGVSATAMESDRIHARGVVMRDAKNREDVATAEGGWLDWLGDCGIPAISGVDTRALVRHIRDKGAMRGGIFPAETSEADARERIAPRPEPSMDGADLAKSKSSRCARRSNRPSGPATTPRRRSCNTASCPSSNGSWRGKPRGWPSCIRAIGC